MRRVASIICFLLILGIAALIVIYRADLTGFGQDLL